MACSSCNGSVLPSPGPVCCLCIRNLLVTTFIKAMLLIYWNFLVLSSVCEADVIVLCQCEQACGHVRESTPVASAESAHRAFRYVQKSQMSNKKW